MDVELTESWAYLTDENQVVQILRYNIDIKCSFHFAWLPFDWQKWHIASQLTVPVEEAIYTAGKFAIDDEIEIAEWDIIDDFMETDAVAGRNIYFESEQSLLEATLVLNRRIDYYARFVIIP